MPLPTHMLVEHLRSVLVILQYVSITIEILVPYSYLKENFDEENRNPLTEELKQIWRQTKYRPS